MQAEHGLCTPDYQNAPGKEGRAMGREHSPLGGMEMGQPLLWHQGGHPRSRSQLWLSGMLPTLTSSVSLTREGCQRLTGPCVTQTPYQTLEQLASQQHHVPHPWREPSPCRGTSGGIAVNVATTAQSSLSPWAGWLMFIKPATEAFMAGHPVSSGITQSSAVLTQDCACSCAHVQNWIFMRFGVWAQSFAIPPDFRSSFSCNSAQEQTIPLWLA